MNAAHAVIEKKGLDKRGKVASAFERKSGLIRLRFELRMNETELKQRIILKCGETEDAFIEFALLCATINRIAHAKHRKGNRCQWLK